jgi:hypothetical protein
LKRKLAYFGHIKMVTPPYLVEKLDQGTTSGRRERKAKGGVDRQQVTGQGCQFGEVHLGNR